MGAWLGESGRGKQMDHLLYKVEEKMVVQRLAEPAMHPQVLLAHWTLVAHFVQPAVVGLA